MAVNMYTFTGLKDFRLNGRQQVHVHWPRGLSRHRSSGTTSGGQHVRVHWPRGLSLGWPFSRYTSIGLEDFRGIGLVGPPAAASMCTFTGLEDLRLVGLPACARPLASRTSA